ncbi:ATP-dependent RNA helicase SUV3 homolog, mitochondrial-like, partial [Oppia nitens]|uniref:ATP-dependent RNA helicase SUV3 homolog, mitochondrial-like n=1 Tax=Oppia nitens TaxID=1686743 RepID=UPI0023DA9669
MSSLRRLYNNSITRHVLWRTHSCSVSSVNKLLFRHKSNDKTDFESIVIPLSVRRTQNPDDINVGEELSGNKLKKNDLIMILNKFIQRPVIRKLSEENGLNSKLLNEAFISFRKHCVESQTLSPELHLVLSDILQKVSNVDDLFPYFIKHAKIMFPHLDCIEELKKISDLRLPPNWYSEARSMTRKVIFHCGPTNSGKTYHALQRFMTSKSGVYCGPLKLLAVEVHQKTNNYGTDCDLVTGEERRYAKEDNMPSNHIACTVEMSSINDKVEVAVIDEIQMIRDVGRGWAWTRALLGIPAEEIHLCGEEAALDLLKTIMESTGEDLEVRRYKRLTPITIEDKALQTLDNIKAGDCIVCFNKKDIFSVSLELEKRGHEVAVIYGTLPPATKLSQTSKFNDPNDPCKVLVATDAIGMGLNLSLRRVIFYSLIKPTLNEKGEKEMDLISTSQALQIAGRAGRYGTQFSHGFVTTFRSEDLPLLKELLSRVVEPIESAGLHPTADQIELFAYHLPNASLSNLIDIFVSLSQVDETNYFMCDIENFKFLADMIQHIPLPLRARYVFCCAPINTRFAFVCTMFLKYARQYSTNQPMTLDWLCRQIGWPISTPKNIIELAHLESVFDVLDLYLWLSYRFTDLFPDAELVRDMQKELDYIILQGVISITKLLRASETHNSYSLANTSDNELITKYKNRKNVINNTIFDTNYDEDINDLNKLTENKPNISDIVFNDKSNKQISKQSLGKQLVKKGLITNEMLNRLQEEWSESLNDNNNSNN